MMEEKGSLFREEDFVKKYFIYLPIVLLLVFVGVKYTVDQEQAIKEEDVDIEEEPYIRFSEELPEEEIEIDKGKPPFIHFYNAQDELVKSYAAPEIEKINYESNALFNQSIQETQEPFIRSYNENGLPQNPTDAEEQEMYALQNGHELYMFSYTSFSGSIQLGQNRDYSNPKNLLIIPTKKVGLLSIHITDSQKQKAGRVEIGNLANGVKIPLADIVQDNHYSIEFVNESDREIVLSGGALVYE